MQTKPATAFAVAAGIVLLLVLGATGAVVLVLVSQPPKVSAKAAEAKPAPAPVPAPPAEPTLSGKVSGRTWKGGDSRYYARLFMDADLEHQLEGEKGLLAISDDLCIKTFAEAVLDGDTDRGQVACVALTRMGPAAKAAIPTIQRAAREHTSTMMRKVATDTVTMLQKL